MKLVFLRGAARKVLLAMALGGALASDPAKAEAVEPAGNVAPTFSVSIRVRLFDLKTATRMKQSSGVVVWLVPADPVATTSPAEPPTYRLVQHDKRFLPHLLVIPAGSMVEFRNQDHWVHNAFSSFGSTRFDLGTERPGTHKLVRLDRPGVLYLFCAMHPEMEAVIVTVDSPYFGISDRRGHVNMPGVPAGTYTVRAWSEGASPRLVDASRHVIVVGEQPGRVPQVSIAMTRQLSVGRQKQSGSVATNAKPGCSSTLCKNLRQAPASRGHSQLPIPDHPRPSAALATSIGSREESQFCDGQ